MSGQDRCPSCGFKADSEAFKSEAKWSETNVMMGKCPSDCGTVLPYYIALFRPQTRGLTAPRITSLTKQLVGMFNSGIAFDREHITAPSHIWANAMQIVVDAPNLRRPLNDHHYLLRVVQSQLQQKSQPEQNGTLHLDDSQKQRADHARGRDSSGLNQVMTEPVAETVDPLKDLAATKHKLLFKQAKIELEQEGVKSFLLGDHLIHCRMREILKKELE